MMLVSLRRGLLAAPLLLLFLLIAYPSLTLIVQSLRVDGALSPANYGALFEPRVLGVLRNSLFISVVGTIGATALGLTLAWLIARTDLPFKPAWQALLIVPYLIPPFIGAIAWVYLLGPVGYLNRFWRSLTGDPLFVIYGEWGVILVMILYTYPIAYLITLGPLRQMNPALEEAAQISGARTLRVLRDITLPLMTPSIGASALLIFMSILANFGIPAVIGFPRRYFVMTNEIYTTILNFDRPNNLQIAAALSMVLVIFALLSLVLQRWLQRSRSYAVLTGKNEQPRLVALGRLRLLALLFVLAVILAAVVAPMLAIFAQSVTPAPGVLLTAENATWRHYEELAGIPKVGRAFFNSFVLSAGAATLIALLAIIIAYLTVRLRVRFSQALNALVLLPYAIPGTVVALAMILAFLQPLPVLNISLYNTIWILLVAYIARFLTFGVQAVSAGFEQVHPSLEEAARISGASLPRALWDIALPLIRSNVLAGWFLAFMPALTELTMSVLLVSVSNETVGQVVFGLHQEGKQNLTAALAFLVTTGVLLLNIAITQITRGGAAAASAPANRG